MSANMSLVLIACVASATAGGVVVAAIRGAVEIVRIIRQPAGAERGRRAG